MPRATLALEGAALRQQLTICHRSQTRVRLRLVAVSGMLVTSVVARTSDFAVRRTSMEEALPGSHDTVDRTDPGSLGGQWIVLFCDAHAKHCPISDFIDECRAAHQIKLFHILELLEQMGPALPRPYADTLRDGVHELRVTLSGEQVRMLYFFCYERFIVFYAVLRKHTDRVPDRHIEATRQYRDDFLRRIDRSQLEVMTHGHA